MNTLRKHSAWWLIALLAGTGSLVVWLCTPWGVEASNDSYFYLSAARNLITGAGLGRLTASGTLIPLTHYPPLYPLLVAGLALPLEGEVLAAARLLAALIFGANAGLLGAICFRYTRSVSVAAGMTLIALVSPVFLSIDLAAMSEGVYRFLWLLGLYLLVRSLEPTGRHLFIPAALVTAAAGLTRYTGLTGIAAGALATFWLTPAAWDKRLGRAALFTFLSVLPLGLWTARNWLVAGAATNRVLAIHLPPRYVYGEALSTVVSWILPFEMTSLSRAVLVLIGLVVILAFGLIWYRQTRSPQVAQVWREPVHFVLLLAINTVVLAAALWTSRAFFDASTRWDTRILSVIYEAGLLIGVLSAWNALKAAHRWRRRSVLAIAALLILGLYIPPSRTLLTAIYTQGRGLTARSWQNSPTLEYLRSNLSGGVVYSNNPAAIYFETGWAANGIPERFDGVKNQVRGDYPANLAAMRQALRTPNSVLVIFNPYGSYAEYPPLEELTEGLSVIARLEDGTVYGLSPVSGAANRQKVERVSPGASEAVCYNRPNPELREAGRPA